MPQQRKKRLSKMFIFDASLEYCDIFEGAGFSVVSLKEDSMLIKLGDDECLLPVGIATKLGDYLKEALRRYE